jgi:tetratricopeptide (TPR) repeat protein
MAESSRPRSEPPAVKRLRAHAQHLLLGKRHDLAEPVLRQLLAIKPDESSLHRQLAGCLLGLRRTDEAYEVARAAVSLDPSSTAALATLASLHMLQGRHEEAVAAHRQALAIKPDYWPAIFGLATAAKVIGEWAEALDWADQGLAMRPNHTGLLRIRGEALATLGQPDAALAAMDQFLHLAPDDANAHRSAAVIMRRLDRATEAAAFARRAMHLNPADPELHNHLAMLNLKERKFDDADQHYKAAGLIYDSRREGQKGPVGVEIQSLMGQAAVNLNKRRFRLAEEQYRRVVEIDPTHHVAAALLAGSIGAQYRFDAALELARDVVERAGTIEVPTRLLAAILCSMERHEEAVELIGEALKRFPESADLFWLLSVIHIDLDDYAKAFDFVEKALRAKASVPIRRTMSVVLAGLGRTADALAAIGASLREESGSFLAEEAAGYAHYLLGDHARAETHLLQALAIDESGLGGHGWLGLVYVAQGRMAEARPLLEKALALNPHQRRVRAALATLVGA